MTKKEKRAAIEKIVAVLKERYPDASCALQYEGDPWRLFVMGRLSAQCTDHRVNIVSKELFKEIPTVEAMKNAPLSLIEDLVKPCGLYRVKAKNIKDSAEILCRDFGGTVPSDMDTLLSLPGVGRKIANLLRGDLFHIPGVVTDTHCIRICGRLGMYPESEKRPETVEKILTELIPKEEQTDFCHRIVFFGRDVCQARSPQCANCPLAKEGLCKKASKK